MRSGYRTHLSAAGYGPTSRSVQWISGGVAFGLVWVLLIPVQLLVRPPMLLGERLWSGAGWIEIFLLALYAAAITTAMQDPIAQPRWRRRVWLLFSLVFFGQLIVGLLGPKLFLMTGDLHLPVPALVLAGPLYRGAGLFMPILFGATLLLVGPAWCSHLCYIGAWDQVAAARHKRAGRLPRWAHPVRWLILVAAVVAAIGLRAAGVATVIATGLAGAFGIIGVALMVLWSRRIGVMTHCTVFCPLGLLANLGGKFSVFRIRLSEECNECEKCSRACRYDALRLEDIQRRRPGLTCSLCGDCIGACKDGFAFYDTVWRSGPKARPVFLAVVAALQAAFLGVARI